MLTLQLGSLMGVAEVQEPIEAEEMLGGTLILFILTTFVVKPYHIQG